MSPENLRHHAAGHLASAVVVARTHPEAAKLILGQVAQFVALPRVSAPPAVTDMLADAQADPAKHVEAVTQLEAWFVDPFNTVIEKSGGKFE